MRFNHTLIRVTDIDKALDFYCGKLGMEVLSRFANDAERYTIIFLCNPGEIEAARHRQAVSLELVWFWDVRGQGGQIVHLGYEVDDIGAACHELMEAGYRIVRPPRDGHWAFIEGPDGIPIELVQSGAPIGERREKVSPQEPWASMPDNGW